MSAGLDQLEERVRRNLGRLMLAARWIMAPRYVGGLLLVVAKSSRC